MYRALGLLALSAAAVPAHPASLEVSAFAGPALPAYDQTFRYDPGPLTLPIPGATARQEGVFTLESRPGLALGGAATLYFAGFLGLEARLDTADAEGEITGARYDVRLEPPAPLPPIDTSLDLGSGEARFERLRPLSLNLKIKTPGPVRLAVSGGVSYLPALEAVVTQTVGLGVTGVAAGRIEVARLAIRAEAVPGEPGREGRLGLNGGAGLQIGLLPTLALVVEARAFVFKKHRLEWSAAETPRTPLEEELLENLLSRLEPVEFNPTFYQATAGIALTF